jgi:CheY-like chemotaxis protein
VAPARILVVDDEPDVAELLGELLGALGHAVETADSCAGALAAVERDAFDLVISDLHLSGGSGVTLAGEIVARRPALAGHIIVVTGDEANAPTTLPVVLKPFRLDDVARIVAAHL